MKKKKIFVTILFISVMMLIPNEVKADPNMDGGGSGGGTSGGTSSNYTTRADDGVRITIIDRSTRSRASGTVTIDYYRSTIKKSTARHFGKSNKIEYMDGKPLTPSVSLYLDGNSYSKPDMPNIISYTGITSNIDKIKNYFSKLGVLHDIASATGIAYDEMTNGKYAVIIEPVIYLTYNSTYMALTAHEAAKLDIIEGGTDTLSGGLRRKFVSYTHKNLPLSIFLKEKDLKIKPWTGGKNVRVSNGQIQKYLGIGILYFEDTEVADETPVVGAPSYTYRPNTDVITSIEVSVPTTSQTFREQSETIYNNPISVTFSGVSVPTTTKSGVLIPPGSSRLVWFKWRTPDVNEKTYIDLNINVSGGGMSSGTYTMTIFINPLIEREPPNPTADDIKPNMWSDTFLPSTPDFPKIGALSKFITPINTRSWHTYTCTRTIEYYWDTDYVFNPDTGFYEPEPVHRSRYIYTWTTNTHTATIVNTTFKITPDTVATVTNPNPNYIKSGYGINMAITSNITGSDTTGMQTAVVYFPESKYKTYRRISKLPGASQSDTLEFPVNLYSIKGSRVHFTPLWFPDNEYKIYAEALDTWTPSGMMCSVGTASIQVQGTLYEDWHIGIIKD